MKEQSYSHHKKYVTGYHFITFALMLLLFFGSIYNLYISLKTGYDRRMAVLLLLTSLILLLGFYYSREFSLKVQDRVIRAEENLRHYQMHTKTLDPGLTMPQILALRFAPDNEFTELCNRALTEKMNSDDIKKSIKNWRADHYRA